MKIVIWLGCILVYSALQAALKMAGVVLGGLPTALLALLLVFLPAPLLCRAWSKRKERQPAAPRHIVVDTSTGEVVGIAKSRAPVIAVASVLALALVVCVCVIVLDVRQPAQEAEPQQGQEQEHIASDFLREKALERAQKIDEIYGPGAYGGTDWLNGE